MVGLHNWLQIYIEEGGKLPPIFKSTGSGLDYLGSVQFDAAVAAVFCARGQGRALVDSSHTPLVLHLLSRYIKPRYRGTGMPESSEQLITIQFQWHGEIKDQSSSFIGTSPQFELALYTLIFLAGEEKNILKCGPYAVEVTAFKYTSHGKNLIGSVFPSVAEGYTPEQAATLIQGVHRGNAVRKAGPAAVAEASRQNQAASAIQSRFRGNQSRSEPRRKKASLFH